MHSERLVSTPILMPMSPAQAAQRAGVSRRTIMRAIEARTLLAHRDNRNRWKVALDDLDNWAAAQCAPSDHAQSEPPTLPTSVSSADAIKLATATAENGQLRERLSDVERDRDYWRNMADKLASRRRWWPFS